MITLVRVLISRFSFRNCIEAPSWSHGGTNSRYRRSVAAVIIMAEVEDMVDGCVASMMVVEDLDKTEEV